MVSATLHRLVHQLGRRHHASDQAGAFGFGRIHHAAGQDQVHRLGLADRARQALRAADARNDAELDLGLAELRVVGRDDDVAQHGELAATAERVSRRRPQPPACARARRGASAAVNSRIDTSLNDWLTISLMSAPAANAFSDPVDQHAADAVVDLELVDRMPKLLEERRVERIERLRPVEPDDPDPAARFDDDVLVIGLDSTVHGSLPACVCPFRIG